MTNKRLLTLAVLFVLLLAGQVGQPAPAYACSCGITTDWSLRLQHYGAIFAGEVIEVGNTYNDEFLRSRIITFKVYAAWKGVSSSHITIYSDKASGGGCGIGFEVGQRWLISTSGDGGSVGICNLPMTLQRSGDALAELGKPAYGSMDALYETNSKDFLPEKEPSNPDPLEGLLPYILAFVVLASIVLVLPSARKRM